MAKTYIISGAASGIGRHMAGVLHAQGHDLVLTDIDEAGLQARAQEGGWLDECRVLRRTLDVRDAAGWQSLVDETVKRFGGLDVMLNIAGYLKPGYAESAAVDEIDRHMDINAKGVMYATRAGAAAMVAAGHGHIVNVASLAGVSAIPGLALYCASKHAVRGYSLAAALELQPRGVHVSVLCPDAVETPMLDLQQDYEEAAMTFSGGRGLSLVEIERAILDVLETKPLERLVALPRSGRGWAAKLSSLFPAIGVIGAAKLRAHGLTVQARRGR